MIIKDTEALRALLPSINIRVDSHRLDDFIRRAQQWVTAKIIGTGIETALEQTPATPDTHADLRLLVQRVMADKAYLLFADEMNLQLGEAGMVVQNNEAMSVASNDRRNNLVESLQSRLDMDSDALVDYLISNSLPEESINPETITNLELDVDTDNMHLMGDPGVAYDTWRDTQQYAALTIAFMPTLQALRAASLPGKADAVHIGSLYDGQQQLANGLFDVAGPYCSVNEIVDLREAYRLNTLTTYQMQAVADLRCVAAAVFAGDKATARQAAIRARKVMLGHLTDFPTFANSPEKTLPEDNFDGGHLVNVL